MITVHHLGVSQSERMALHPMEAAPVITDGELLLAKSGAIIDYVIAKLTPVLT